MAKYRIGNDLTILWKVYDREGKALFLNDKEVRLFYTCERGRFEADINIQEDNIVVWDFYGSLQKTLGEYSLTLEIFQSDGMRSIKKDVCGAFVFVGKDCEADVKDTTLSLNGEVVAHQEIIKTNLDVCRVSPVIPYVVRDENGIGYWYVDGVNTGDRSTGETAYEYAKSQGYTGTEEDFAKKLVEAPDWNANLGEKGYIQNRPFRIIDSVSGDEYKFDTSLKESDFTLFIQENEYGDKVSAKWEKIISDPNAYIMGVFANGYYNALHDTFYKGAIRPLGPLYRRGYLYDEGDNRKYSIYIENISEDNGDYYEEYSKLIVENISDYGTAFPRADVYVITNEDNPVRIDAIDENYLPDTIARTNDVDELREETTALWENLDHGTFPNLVAGDLAGRGESVPAEFGFRASGGKSIKDGRAYIKRIKGNSVVWNNMVDTRGYEAGFIIREGIKIQQGHKYLLQRSAANNGLYLIPVVGGSENYEMSLRAGEYAKICTSQYTDLIEARVYSESYCGACVISDLTKMFQAGNEPSTIDEFNARVATLGIDMYAYNEGEVIHCNTESIKSVGDNAFDDSRDNFITDYDYNTPGDYSFMNEQDVYVGATRDGYAYWYNVEDYSKSGNGYSFRPTGGGYGLGMMVKALPNEEYSITWKSDKGQVSIGFYDSNKKVIDHIANTNTFVTPSNCEYILLVLCALDNHIGEQVVINDIMLTLVHSGWKQDTDAGYQPYWQDTLPLPIIRKYFPDGMKKAGSAHDEIRYNKASGKWEKVVRIAEVDMSQFGWYQGSGFWASWNSQEFMADMKKPSDNGEVANICCKKYVAGSWTSVYEATEGNIAMYSDDGRIGIADSSIQSDADIMAATQGVILYYELAEPIVTELDAEDQNFRDYYNVADFGTEMSQSSVPSAAFSADIIYQFNAVDMIRELWLKVQELESRVAQL